MSKIAAPAAMIAAVEAVAQAHRLAAAQMAERVFADRLVTLVAFDDFSAAANRELAAEAAAAEVAYRFG